MKYLILLLFVTTSIVSNAQVLNGNKNTVAEFYDGDVTQININGGKLEFQYRLWNNPRLFFGKKDGTEVRTAIKKDAIFLDGGFTNTKSFLDFKKLDVEDLGFSLGATYQHSFSRIVVSGLNNPLRSRHRTFITSIKLSFERFDNFDSETNMIENKLPATLFIRGGYNKYYFKENITWIRALNFKFNLIDNNASSLSNFILNENSNTVENITITNTGNFDGKFGVLDNELYSTNFSVGVPIVFNKKTFVGYLAPIPYLSWETFSASSPRYNAGFALGFLGKPILDGTVKNKNKGEENDDKAYKYQKFNAPSFLSIGVDWNNQGGQGSKPNYFVSGTFKF